MTRNSEEPISSTLLCRETKGPWNFEAKYLHKRRWIAVTMYNEEINQEYLFLLEVPQLTMFACNYPDWNDPNIKEFINFLKNDPVIQQAISVLSS